MSRRRERKFKEREKKEEEEKKESSARPTGSREMNKNWIVRSLAEWTNDPALLYINTDTKKP